MPQTEARMGNGIAQTKGMSRLWPDRVLGPRPGLKEVNVLCWGLFVLLLIVPLGVHLFLRYRAGGRFADLLPIDFIYFYGIGRLVNEHPSSQFYDLSLQTKVFNEIYQLHGRFWGGSPYPPLVGRIFSLFARLNIAQAYYLWLVTSLILYLTGIIAALRAVFPRDHEKRSLFICFSLAFPAFLSFTLMVGQISSIAIFSVGLAIYEERHSRHFSSGLALSILSYKPTLLVVLLPMLVLTRRFRALAGFFSGVLIWILFSTVLSGVAIWPAYARFLFSFAGRAGINGQSLIDRTEYIDLFSLSYIVRGGRSPLGLVLLAAVVISAAVWLGVLFWKSASLGESHQLLVWAAALTSTLLLNLYVPIYDSVLVTVAIALTLGALAGAKTSGAADWIVLLGLGAIPISAISETFARHHPIQLLTVLLFFLGLAQVSLLQVSSRKSESAHEAGRAPDSSAA
jgi:hypothetical protein